MATSHKSITQEINNLRFPEVEHIHQWRDFCAISTNGVTSVLSHGYVDLADSYLEEKRNNQVFTSRAVGTAVYEQSQVIALVRSYFDVTHPATVEHHGGTAHSL